VARQLTIMESVLYQAIEPQEFLDCAWSGEEKETKSPNLLAFITHFNKFSKWITFKLVSPSTIKARVENFQFFIHTADECKKLNNYNGMFQITSAMASTPIGRLKRTYDQIPYEEKKKYMKS